DELGGREALVPDLDRMAQRPPTELARQQGEEGRDVVRVKPLGAHQLPEERPKTVASLVQALRDTPLQRWACFGKQLAVGHVGRTLDREDEPVRRLLPPGAETLRLLQAVVRRVDLDGAELA